MGARPRPPSIPSTCQLLVAHGSYAGGGHLRRRDGDSHGRLRPPWRIRRKVLSRRAGEVWYVPASQCRHIYNQSAAGSADAARYYAESERKYLEKWSGALATRLIKRLELNVAPAVPLASGDIMLDRDGVVVEASPHASFDTAAGLFPRQRRVVIPPEVWSSYRNSVLWVRVVERASGAVLATFSRRRIGS